MKSSSEFQKRICKKIDEILKKRKLKRKHLADALTLTPSLISRMFAGESTMSLLQLDKICSYLNMEVAELIAETRKPNTTFHIFDEKDADIWCQDELALLILVLFVRRPITQIELRDLFPEHKHRVDNIILSLMENNLVIKKPDNTLIINPPNFMRYGVGKSKNFLKNFFKLHQETVRKYFSVPTPITPQKQISWAQLNWFTESQLYYISEQIQNLDSVVTNLIADNKRNNFKNANFMSLLYLNNLVVMNVKE